MSSTIISWGLTISLLGAAVYIYRPDILRAAPQSQTTKPAATESLSKGPGKKTKSKKPNNSKTATLEDTTPPSDNAGEPQSSKKRKIVAPPANQGAATRKPDEQQQKSSQADDDGMSDKDFAKQLAMTQTGTKLQPPAKQQPSKKERRASKLTAAGNAEPSGFSTEASSTAGRDADDDLTPIDSPQTTPADGPMSRAGDVSDMLEAPAAKPTTLRLTDVSNDAKPKRSAPKAFEQVLSKKKRNEQQRKEEQRLLREESDRIHEAKKQEQLRRARMAAGTSNQTKANNFAAKSNAWQSGATDSVKAAPTDATEPFLDTFEPSQNSMGSTEGAVHVESTGTLGANDLKAQAGGGAAAALTASSREGLSQAKRQEYGSGLSEEDQMKILQEQQDEDAWESVTTKKSKRKGKQEGGDVTSSASSPHRPEPKMAQKPVNGTKVNGAQKAQEATNRFASIQANTSSGLQDAEWEA